MRTQRSSLYRYSAEIAFPGYILSGLVLNELAYSHQNR